MSTPDFALSNGIVFNVAAIETISPVDLGHEDAEVGYRSRVTMTSGQQWLDRRTVDHLAHYFGLGVAS